jgi:DNA-binding MarR family transcriptional regulator
VILALLDGADEDTLRGRPVLQKLSYFAGIALGENLGHSAYYYGPFSREVVDGLEIAALAGQVEEISVRVLEGPRDVREYRYVLTEEGREAVAALRQLHSEEVDVVHRVLRDVQEVVPGLDGRSLSQAAKIHYILTQENAPLTTAELSDVASRVGWQLTEDDVDSTVKLLGRLQLVETVPAE